ncbi:hypothetical protein [Nocardioides piscis]|uniref:Uncharacterized protein n=1 Tax=Nocardioides piscis TaxID=2714938 RepID=A0A6G7YHG5_9ACTN|nr:hypothetical protein [Nocardioides piscis]QIK76078.1 hypothetical protein G7071_12215 [Nocardioides piscis]
MSWLAVLLIGVALTDLTHSARPVRLLPELVGATGAVVVGLLAGLTAPADLVALALIALAVLGWGRTVTSGFAGRLAPWVPLTLLGASVAVVVLVAGQASPADGPLARWLDATPVPVLADLDATRALMLVGAFGIQLSSGNVIVRLVLAATGTVNPTHRGQADDPATKIKGGRLLGPMERVFILALALAGEVTAAGIVVAAKGLLRFPELSSRRDQEHVHLLTEYFLVGSFVSWLVALGSLVLLQT